MARVVLPQYDVDAASNLRDDDDRARRDVGFTLVEALIVLVILGIVTALGLPALQNLIERSKTEGAARNTAVLMRSARYEAINAGLPGIVAINPAATEVVGFLDASNPPNGTLEAGEEVVGRVRLGSHIAFRDESGNTGVSSVDDFDNPAPLADDRVVFNTDGSVESTGAFRIADVRDNILEVRVDSMATGRADILKWDPDEGDYFEQDEEGKNWTWN